MEKLIRAITTLVSRPGFKGGKPAAPRRLDVDLAGAPAAIRELAEAMAAHYYYVDLGEFSMFENGASSIVPGLASVIETSAKEGRIDLAAVLVAAGADGTPFDPARTLELGADGGGMSTLGASWSGGKLALIMVEIEDPVEDNLIRRFDTPAQFFAWLGDKNDGEESDDLRALKAAAG